MRIAIEINGVLRNTIDKIEQTYQKYMIDKTDGLEDEESFKYEISLPVDSLNLKNHFKFQTDEELYFKSSIIFFNNRKFNKEHLEYYNEVRSLICTYDKIINYTFDRTLVYICDKKNNIISTYTNNLSKPTFNDPFLEYHFINNNINLNEIVIADKRFVNHNLRLLKKINIPKYMRYTKSDIFMRYFEDEIYLYVKN